MQRHYKENLSSYKCRLLHKENFNFSELLAKEYSHTINLFYPSGIQFSFAVTQCSFADSYLIMEVFGLASKMTPSSATISDNNVSESAKFHLIINQSSDFSDQLEISMHCPDYCGFFHGIRASL